MDGILFWKGDILMINRYELIRPSMDKVEAMLKSSLRSKHRIINSSIKDLLESGGKRLRPALLVVCGNMGNKESPRLITMAAIVEILHMATLVHDDIIDDALFRRGVTTVQAKWGKDIAVFLGDYLFSTAFALITDNCPVENFGIITKTLQNICEGEISQYEDRFSTDVSRIRYLKRIMGKTAALFGLSCYLGAHESGCSGQQKSILFRYGISLGMAFQIADDVLDFIGDEQRTGKPKANDFTQGIYTLPVIHALRDKSLGPTLKEILQSFPLDKNDIKRVIAIVQASGGIEYSIDLINRYINRAVNTINTLPDNGYKAILIDLLDNIKPCR